MRKIILLFLMGLAVGDASAQTTTPYTGVIKDQTQNVIPSGQMTYGAPAGPPGPTGCVLGSNCTSALSPKSVNGVVYASQYAGRDIGAKVNAAIADINGCGQVVVAPGSFTWSTPVVKPRCVRLVGASSPGTVLNFVGTSGCAITISDGGSPNLYSSGGIEDLTLNGSGLSNTAIGICIGDSSHTDWADHQNLNRLKIMNWNTGVTWGANAWSTTVLESVITDNNTGIYYPTGLFNSGEAIAFIGTRIQNSRVVGINQPGFSDFYFYGSSCDYNATCAIVTIAHFYGMHFETGPPSRMVTVGAAGSALPSVEIIGGDIVYTTGSGTFSDIIYVNSTNNPMFKISGTYINISVGATLSELVNWNGSGAFAQLDIEDIPYMGAPVPSLTNTSCLFVGCYIHDGSLGVYANNFNGGHITTGGDATFNSVETDSPNGAGLGAHGGFGIIHGNASGLALWPSAVGTGTPGFMTTTTFNFTPFDAAFKSLRLNGGTIIKNTNLIPQVGTPIVGQAACIKAAGPPVVIGYCSSVVSAGGACTCN